jgi:hypothetical protein
VRRHVRSAELLMDRVFDVGADAADQVAALVADLVVDRGAQASGVDRASCLARRVTLVVQRLRNLPAGPSADEKSSSSPASSNTM